MNMERSKKPFSFTTLQEAIHEVLATYIPEALPMHHIITPGKWQFSIDTNDGWLTANRTSKGVFFDQSRPALLYLRHEDRQALIQWLQETPDEAPLPKRPGGGKKRSGTHGRERV